MVPGTSQQAMVCGTIRRMLECSLQEMARAITELQFEFALSGYLISRPSYTKESKDMMMSVWEQLKRDSGL